MKRFKWLILLVLVLVLLPVAVLSQGFTPAILSSVTVNGTNYPASGGVITLPDYPAVQDEVGPTRTPTLATVAAGVCWITSQGTDLLTIPQDGGAVTNSFAASAIGVREAYSIIIGTNSVTWPGTNSTTFAWDTGQEVPTSAVPYSVEAISESYKTNFVGRVRAF